MNAKEKITKYRLILCYLYFNLESDLDGLESDLESDLDGLDKQQ